MNHNIIIFKSRDEADNYINIYNLRKDIKKFSPYNELE